jgi:mRNA interferase RelE/StbE
MAYSVELSTEVDRELDKLDAQHSKRILKFLHARVAKLDDPRSIGEALHGSRLGEFWKYRVGDHLPGKFGLPEIWF